MILSSGAISQAINRAFPRLLEPGPETWNALPEDVTSSQSEYIFFMSLGGHGSPLDPPLCMSVNERSGDVGVSVQPCTNQT